MFYHLTQKENVHDILHEGLICCVPGEGNFENADSVNVREYHCAVYAFGLLDEAKQWHTRFRYTYRRDAVIVEFQPKWFPFRDHIANDVEGYTSAVYFKENIPVEDIKAVILP